MVSQKDKSEWKFRFKALIVIVIFLLTTLNLHNYPMNPNTLMEFILAFVGLIIWLSPFIVLWLTEW